MTVIIHNSSKTFQQMLIDKKHDLDYRELFYDGTGFS